MDDSNNLEFLQEFHHSDYYKDLDDKVFKPRGGVVVLDTVTGTNRVLLRHVVLSLKFDGAEYLREEEKSSVLIQVTEYLCPIWHTNFAEHINVTFKNHNGFIQDLDAFNKAFRFLQLGSMNVNKYHQLVNEVYIKGDGSGGTISWGPRPRDDSIFYPGVYCDSVEFLTTDSGLRLLPQRPEQELKLMTLPADVQYKIYDMLLQEAKIDADKTASPISHLCYVNQELLHSKAHYLRDVKLIDITTTTTLTETTFSDFDNLRKLVRNMFDHKLGTWWQDTFELCPFANLADRCRDSGHPRQCELKFNLHFNVHEAVMLEDLRISILPFVMETSQFRGATPVTISIFSERTGAMVPGATHSISLSTLRSRVLAALTATIGALSKWESHGISHVCINGRGEVIDSRVDKIPRGGHLEMPKFASKIVAHGPMGPYEFDDYGVHPIDAAYRGNHWTWNGRNGSCHWYYNQVFPFTHSPDETLKYLQWVVQPESLPLNQRRLKFISQGPDED